MDPSLPGVDKFPGVIEPYFSHRKKRMSVDWSTCTTLDTNEDDSLMEYDHRKVTGSKSKNTMMDSQTGNDRQNHSEIEKRRRDKMNAYITELSSMLPMCNAMNRKLDKLTVLRMAVQHLKSLREGAAMSIPEARPSFLSDDDLKHLILEAAEGFLFVVSCDRARILYVSESVRNILNYTRLDLIGQSLLDYLHPHDINKVKEQLSASDVYPRERLIDARTMMPVKTELIRRPTYLCSGARRSFFCRMKSGSSVTDLCSGLKSEKDIDLELCSRKKKSDRKSFTVIHCTGYLKSWPSSSLDMKEQEDSEDNCDLSCLVAVGQIKTTCDRKLVDRDSDINVRSIEYVSRMSIDGKFTFVDQGATILLGYLPQELLGTSVYEFYHQDDISVMSDIHRKVLKSKEKVKTNVYRFKIKDGSFVHLRSECFSFRNPWTKEVEYIVSTNTFVPEQEVTSSGQSMDAGSEVMEGNCNWEYKEDQQAGLTEKRKNGAGAVTTGTKLGAGRIGRQIAEEMIEMQRGFNTTLADSTNSVPVASTATIPGRHFGLSNGLAVKVPVPCTDPPVATATEVVVPSEVAATLANQVAATRKNGLTVPTQSPTTAGAVASTSAETNLIEGVIAEQESTENEAGQSNEQGNDEAAMSIIMSLLEADAGLGGPIDFNDLPWPL
ncbi:protein cycle-like [Saccostrea echinata]|uniref:protein cycle-like n=1 Tax=Saccostrea echinata TaxID=191078 RepID=UPI002A81EFA3|nr:protein cycle-like [Saccostrea echinata]